MGLSGETPLGEAKTKAPNSDYHKNEPLAAARQEEAAWDYFKRAVRTNELIGHSPGSDQRAYGHRAQEVQRGPGAGLFFFLGGGGLTGSK